MRGRRCGLVRGKEVWSGEGEGGVVWSGGSRCGLVKGRRCGLVKGRCGLVKGRRRDLVKEMWSCEGEGVVW